MSNLLGTVWFLGVARLATATTPASLTLYSGIYAGSSMTFTRSVPDFSKYELPFTPVSGCVYGMWLFYMDAEYESYLSSYAGITEKHCFAVFSPILSAQFVGSSSDGSACAIAIFADTKYSGVVSNVGYPVASYFKDGEYDHDYDEFITPIYGYAIAGINSGSCYIAIPTKSGCIYAESYGTNTINQAQLPQAPTAPGNIFTNKCPWGS